MSQKPKAPCFRGHVRKTVSPFGVVSWVSEVRTPAKDSFRSLGMSPTVGEAIALAIQTATTQAHQVQVPAEIQPLRQAA